MNVMNVFYIEKSLHDTPLPIVAVTAHAMGEFRDKCFAAGMQVYWKIFILIHVSIIYIQLCHLFNVFFSVCFYVFYV